MGKKEMSEATRCPGCGGEDFTEETMRRLLTSPVQIVDGEPEYGSADTPDEDNATLYLCNGCDAEYALVDGALVPTKKTEEDERKG